MKHRPQWRENGSRVQGRGGAEDRSVWNTGRGREEREAGLTQECAEPEGHVTHQGSWNLKSTDIDKRPGRIFRQGFIGALGASGRESNK